MRQSPRPKRDEPEDESKRGFLKGAAALGGAVLIGAATVAEHNIGMEESEVKARETSAAKRFERYEEGGIAEREFALERDIDLYGNSYRGDETWRILERGSDEEIFKLLVSLPAISRKAIRGTTYDIPSSDWPSVMVGSVGPDVRIAQINDLGSLPDVFKFHTGNAVMIAYDEMLTNVHVIEERKQIFLDEFGTYVDQLQELGTKRSIDLGRVKVPARKLLRPTTPRILRPDHSLTANDVHGRFIRVAGLDSDYTADPDHTKIYPSLAIRVTPRLAEFLHRYGEDEEKKMDPAMLNSFLYLAPAGEAITRRGPSKTGSRLLDTFAQRPFDLMAGMSGSPVLGRNDELAEC